MKHEIRNKFNIQMIKIQNESRADTAEGIGNRKKLVPIDMS